VQYINTPKHNIMSALIIYVYVWNDIVLTVNPLFSKVSCINSELTNADQDNSHSAALSHHLWTVYFFDGRHSHTTRGLSLRSVLDQCAMCV